MKNIFLTALLFTIVSMNAQQFTSQSEKELLLQKSKNQKTTAWILLGAGTTAAVVGAISFDNNWNSSSYTTTDIYGVIMVAGVVADLVSIPFFISSGKNKRKAASISMSYINYSFQQNAGSRMASTPLVGLKIRY